MDEETAYFIGADALRRALDCDITSATWLVQLMTRKQQDTLLSALETLTEVIRAVQAYEN